MAYKKIQFTKGTAKMSDGKGGVEAVTCAYINECNTCAPDVPCEGEYMLVKDEDNPGEWFQVNLFEWAKTLTAPVVTKVTK